MADKSAVLFLLLLLVSSSLFLLHNGRTPHSSITNEDMATVVRKGSGGHGVGHGVGHGGVYAGRGGSIGGKSIPFITAGAVVPKTNGASSHDHKHNAAHNGYNFSIAVLLIICAFWLVSLASL